MTSSTGLPTWSLGEEKPPVKWDVCEKSRWIFAFFSGKLKGDQILGNFSHKNQNLNFAGIFLGKILLGEFPQSAPKTGFPANFAGNSINYILVFAAGSQPSKKEEVVHSPLIH